MRHLIATILCFTYVQAYHQQQQRQQHSNNPPPSAYKDRNPAPNYYPGQVASQPPYNVPVMQYPEYLAAYTGSYYPGQRQSYNDAAYGRTGESYLSVSPYTKAQGVNSGYYPVNPNSNLRQAQKSKFFRAYVNPFDVEEGGDSDGDDNKSASEGQSYYDDLELVENFGNYLRRRTQLDPSSRSLNDPPHQYNALLSVIIALARVVRNACTDLDQVYDQVYASTVDTFYKYGLTNAEKVSEMIDEYIKKGNSHIPRIRKLKQEICEKDLFCAVTVDNKINSSPLLYVKELETLDALSHLARSYYPYIEEFNQAARKGAVLPYLQNSKERLKEYVMHVVNSVEHLTDKTVRCP